MPNSQSTYDKVQQTLVDMRRAGELPYGWLTDHSRSVYHVRSYATVTEAMQATANSYRKALWVDVPVRIEIWVEKKALIGVLWPIVREYDVALYPAGGFTSLSFANDAAEEIASYEKPTVIYYLGDYDPSGVLIGEKIEEALRDRAPEAEIHFIRLAVTPEQIVEWNLPGQPTKQSSHNRGWTGDSVELDAIAPDDLRSLVREAIEQWLPREQLEILKLAEESERELLRRWAGGET